MSEPWNRETIKELLYKSEMYGLSEKELDAAKYAWDALQVEIGELQRRSMILGEIVTKGNRTL